MPTSPKAARTSIDGPKLQGSLAFAGKAGILPQFSTENEFLSRRGTLGSVSTWINEHAAHDTSSCHGAAS